MKKLVLLIIAGVLSVSLHAAASVEHTYVAVKDTSVHMNQPDTNYGDWTTAETSEVTEISKCIAYYSFDFSEFNSDDAQILNPPNSRVGFWYEADVTREIKRLYANEITKIDMQVLPERVKNANINGRFYTREADFNKPHLKIRYSDDKTSVIDAKLYIFGGTSSSRLTVNTLVGSYDEMKVTYNTKPLCGSNIGYLYRNAALSGRPEQESLIETVGGMSYETAMSTTMSTFESKFPDYIKWHEVYNISNAPTVERVLSDFGANPKGQEHPRIRGGKEDWERIRRWYKEGNEYVVKWGDLIISSADKSAENFDIPLDFTYNDSGSDMLYRGEDIVPLGMAYQLTLDKKYSDAAYKKMEIMCNYSHWNDSGKDLNVGDCAKNVGTAYDLVYDALTPQQRNTVVGGIVRHVMDTRIGRPNSNTNNWNPVTNGGFGIAALAIMNEQPYKGAEMIVQSVAEIPKSLMEYYPDGSFPEGVAYWSYMSENLFGFGAALEQTLGTSYSLLDFKGLSETGYFPMYMQGPSRNTRFKYGDDKMKAIGAYFLFYLAKRYDNPDFAQYQLEYIKNNNAYSDFAPYWCDDDTFKTVGMYKKLPTDRYFDGFTPVVTMRSAWEDKNALFAGTKGGFPQISHSDLDTGTFIAAALGVEWTKEFYPLYTTRVGFPSQSRMTRYLFYGSSPQGHNTLFFHPGQIYPDMDYGQEVNTHTRFEKFYSDENSAFTILDMSDAYRKYSQKTRRGIGLINNKREFIIQDEIDSGSGSLVYWFMHTDTDIELNGDEAILTSGDKRLYCKILSPINANFEIMPAKSLPNTPTIADYDEDAYDGHYKLAIKTEIAGKQTIAVWMVPLTSHDEIPSNTPSVCSLDSWPMPERDAARLENVTLNGEPLAEFSPEKLVYDINVIGKDFDIEGFGDSVSVCKKEYRDSVILECSSAGKNSIRYVFNRIETNDLSKITFYASDVPQLENSPENTLDNDTSTCWASLGEQYITYDLSRAEYLDSVSVAFYQGAVRMYNFRIDISEDGENYTTVFDGRSNGITEELVRYQFERTRARYVRITCNGSNVNNWNNIGEVVFGYAD